MAVETMVVVNLVDYVPETIMDGHGTTKDMCPTPETLSVLTETDESLSISSGSKVAVSPTTSSSRHGGKIQSWCGTKYYSDLIREGLSSDSKEVVMVYESPACSNANSGSSFYNGDLFQFHDYPLTTSDSKTVLGPLRYGAMTGAGLPTYLQSPPPAGLLEHWAKSIPDLVLPSFCREIPDTAKVCAYLPLEQFQSRHLIDPHVHYEIAGKDAIPNMTLQTTKLLPDMDTVRPCIVKVNHSMGGRGIFVIENDQDKADCLEKLEEAGGPGFIVTDFVDIERNLAAHFFIHPSGDITWFGSSENLLDREGGWSSDATIRCMQEQDELKDLLAPFVQDIAQYCLSRGYWGACGIDVLMDPQGKGYVVDVNPRVTGTCPALMAFQKLAASNYDRFAQGVFRRSKKYVYPGTAEQLLRDVEAYNESHDDCRVVIFSLFERDPECTFLNIGVYGSSQVQCVKVLNEFARKR